MALVRSVQRLLSIISQMIQYGRVNVESSQTLSQISVRHHCEITAGGVYPSHMKRQMAIFKMHNIRGCSKAMKLTHFESKMQVPGSLKLCKSQSYDTSGFHYLPDRYLTLRQKRRHWFGLVPGTHHRPSNI